METTAEFIEKIHLPIPLCEQKRISQTTAANNNVKHSVVTHGTPEHV